MKLPHRLPAHSGLYAPAGPVLSKDIIFCKYYPSHHIALRPMSITTDLPAVYRWAWPGTHAGNMIAATYLYTRECNFARSFMALRDNTIPVAQIDICHAPKDEVSDDYAAGPQDFIIHLLINPRQRQQHDLYYHLLQICTEYFFLFPEVEKLLIEADADNSRQQQILQKAGFSWQQQICLSYRKTDLYCCNSNQYIQSAGW